MKMQKFGEHLSSDRSCSFFEWKNVISILKMQRGFYVKLSIQFFFVEVDCAANVIELKFACYKYFIALVGRVKTRDNEMFIETQNLSSFRIQERVISLTT